MTRGATSHAAEASTRLLTAAEAAALLTIPESTVRAYARRGTIPSVKLGRHLRFFEADLVAYLEDLRNPLQAARRS